MSVEHFNILVADSQRKNMKDLNSFSREVNRVAQFGEDSLNTSLKGLVQIHENVDDKKELISQTSNLITYSGRSMMLCRAMGKNLNYLAGTPTAYPFYGMKDKFVAFFAVGSGGASSTNNQNPLVVNSTDFQLASHGTLTGAEKLVTVNGRAYMGFDDDYPRFVTEPEVVNTDEIYTALRNQTYDGYRRDSYLISKIQVTLGAEVANGSGSQEISEAGLFLAESDDTADPDEWWTGGAYASGYHLEMFAKTTFPTISKNANRSFVVTWYIFF